MLIRYRDRLHNVIWKQNERNKTVQEIRKQGKTEGTKRHRTKTSDSGAFNAFNAFAHIWNMFLPPATATTADICGQLVLVADSRVRSVMRRCQGNDRKRIAQPQSNEDRVHDSMPLGHARNSSWTERWPKMGSRRRIF